MFDIYNSWSKVYKSTFGALKIHEVCRFSVKIPLSTKYDSNPVMIIFRTGFKERFLTMQKAFENDEFIEYTTEYTPNFMGVHYYYFGLINNGVKFFIKKKTASAGGFGDGGLFQLTVYDDNFKTPEFLKGGIMYQIFPDRFFNSGIPKENIPTDRVIRENWGETPFYCPDQNGHVWNNDYFGGDLQGIIRKLKYLKSLGVTCLYLNPIFEAHENHRYNTADYMKVDPQLGTETDFEELCEKAKGMGISVILDGVFNHTGADSVYFNKYKRYNTIGAYNSQDSKYYSWYSFIEYPDKYESWWGIDTLPDVNELDKDYLNYICGKNGVLEHWLRLGACGYRLDVVDELPDNFLDELNACVKRVSSENLIIGEVWEDASNKESYGMKRRYLIGGQLDSVMNYPFKDAIIFYIKGGSAQIFHDWIMTILENYPKPSIDCLMNFLSTHDIMRAITNFGGDSPDGKNKDWQAERYLSNEQYQHGKNLLKCAMVLQYFLPGVPSIYYGDEVGLQGYGDPFNRRCYPWGNEDTELLEFTRRLGEIRHSCEEFRDGSFEFLACCENYLSFIRYNFNHTEAVIIMLNKSYCEMRLSLEQMLGLKAISFEVLKGNASDDEIVISDMDYSVIKVKI